MSSEDGASSCDASSSDEAVKHCPPPQSRGDDLRQTISRRPAHVPSRLVFASCNSQNLTQPLWPIIASRSPGLAAFVWGGDAIYADHFAGIDFSHGLPHPVHVSATPDELRRYYDQQLSHPGYRQLLDLNVTIFGTMDDHDYGANNGDKNYKYKRESGVAFVDFTGEPRDSPIRRRAEAGKGVYGVKVFDFSRGLGEELVSDADAGVDPDVVGYDAEVRRPSYSERSVAVFVLDVRTNRTPWSKGLAAWRQSLDGDFLGQEQWEWFETALRRSRASVNIVVTGLQVHANRFPSSNIAEEWVKFPRARQRLYAALLQTGVRAPLIVSGDVHMAQLLRKDCYRRSAVVDIDGDVAADQASSSRPLVELTTSGLTHSWGTCFASSQKYHERWYAPYFHLMSRTVMTFGHKVAPWTELIRTDPSNSAYAPPYESGGAEGAKTGKQFSLELNFGEMEFDWNNELVKVRVIGVDGPDTPLFAASWSFDQLSGNEPMPGNRVRSADISRANEELSPDDEWVCVNYQGLAHPVHYFLGTLAGSTMLFGLVMLPNVAAVVCALYALRMLVRKLYSRRVKVK